MSFPEDRPPEAANTAEAALEELRRQNAELIEAVAARDTFIAVAAHELRNPMTPIVGQIDLLLAALQAGRYSSGQVEHRVRRIRRAMDHFIKRAGTLLDVSRITSGRFQLALAPCDLSDLVRETVETFTETARYSGCSIPNRGARKPSRRLGSIGSRADPRQSYLQRDQIRSFPTGNGKRGGFRLPGQALSSGMTVPAYPQATGPASSNVLSERLARMSDAVASASAYRWLANS